MTEQTQIVILEDCMERRRLMTDVLRDRFAQVGVLFFYTSGEAIVHLRENMDRLLAVILDHDLELIEVDKHRLIDPGTGRDVADYLATQSPVCPVVVHSTNSPAAIGMLAALEDAGWSTERVIPVGEFKWIRTIWIKAVQDAITRFACNEKNKVLTS